jgi:hypothetical protein
VDGKARSGPDLSVTHFSGLKLPNPFVIGSGEPTFCYLTAATWEHPALPVKSNRAASRPSSKNSLKSLLDKGLASLWSTAWDVRQSS